MWWTVWSASSCVVCLRLGAGEDSLLTMPMDADYKKPCRKPILCSQKKKRQSSKSTVFRQQHYTAVKHQEICGLQRGYHLTYANQGLYVTQTSTLQSCWETSKLTVKVKSEKAMWQWNIHQSWCSACGNTVLLMHSEVASLFADQLG